MPMSASTWRTVEYQTGANNTGLTNEIIITYRMVGINIMK